MEIRVEDLTGAEHLALCGLRLLHFHDHLGSGEDFGWCLDDLGACGAIGFVRRVPEVVECHLLAGRSDYLMRIVISDMAEYEALHRSRLTLLPGVAKMETTFNLRTVTPYRGLPIGTIKREPTHPES